MALYVKYVYKSLGGHVHVTVFLGEGLEYTFANAGALVFRNEEWEDFMSQEANKVIEYKKVE